MVANRSKLFVSLCRNVALLVSLSYRSFDHDLTLLLTKSTPPMMLQMLTLLAIRYNDSMLCVLVNKPLLLYCAVNMSQRAQWVLFCMSRTARVGVQGSTDDGSSDVSSCWLPKRAEYRYDTGLRRRHLCFVLNTARHFTQSHSLLL